MPPKEFSKDELQKLYKLTYSIYQADLDLIHAVSKLPSESEYSDTKKMHDAARKIQFWARTKRQRDSAIECVRTSCDEDLNQRSRLSPN